MPVNQQAPVSGRQRPERYRGSARSMLLTMLGEFVLPGRELVWTASMLYVLSGMGIAEQTARQAIARAADAGWIESEKLGREVRWRMAPGGTALIADITERVRSLSNIPVHWDGTGLILTVTVTKESRAVRKRLYSALSWAGWGTPAPGLWINPHLEREKETREVIERLGLEESTLSFVGHAGQIGIGDREMVARGWQLDDVADRYAELLARFENLNPQPGDQVLFTHLALVDQWRKFPYMDPQLPHDVLPDWIGRRAAATFFALRHSWAPAAHSRWREIVVSTAPDRDDREPVVGTCSPEAYVRPGLDLGGGGEVGLVADIAVDLDCDQPAVDAVAKHTRR